MKGDIMALTTASGRKRKGCGSIQKKDNGTYLGRLRITGYDTFYYTGTSEKEVQKELNEFRLKTLRKEIIPQKQTVNSYIERWLTTVKMPSLKASSYDRMERTYQKQIKNTAVGRSQLGTLSSMEIQTLINSYTTTLAYSSLKKVYDLLNNCFRYAVAVRDMGYNPVDGVRLPKQENMSIQTKEIEILSENDVDRLEKSQYDLYKTGRLKYWYASAYVLILNTGIRSGEALALTWDKVNLRTKTLTICQNASRIKNRDTKDSSRSKQIITSTKSRSGTRQIPLNSKALAALAHLKELQEKHHIQTDFVICTATGKMVVQNSFYRIFQNMQKSLGIKPVTIHALRHTFATQLITANVDIKIVSQLLGHASVKITYDTYVHTDLDRAFSAVQSLE